MPIHELKDLDLSAVSRATGSNSFRKCADPATERFCQALSSRLLRDPEVRQYPDVMTFGYFCRKSSISKVLTTLPNREQRVGWGPVLHIAPSNIPVNFAFSFLMGFLSGNTNFVRVPSRAFRQVDIIINAVDDLLDTDEFDHLRPFANFFTCERGDPALLELVKDVAGIVVWGGDSTVKTFRALEKRVSAVELYFPDRVSSAVLSAKDILALEDEALNALSDRFFNDTFLVDQNACSSPGITFWVGTKDNRVAAKDRFWKNVGTRLSGKYSLAPILMMDKHLDVISMVESLERPVSSPKRGDVVWRFDDPGLGATRLRFGNFADIDVDTIGEIGQHLRTNEQTITQFGLDSREIFEILASSGHIVDRIVPVGDALSMSMDWDGKQALSLLSRQVEIR